MYCILVTNKWTNYKYFHPVPYTTFEAAVEDLKKMGTLNSTYQILPVGKQPQQNDLTT